MIETPVLFGPELSLIGVICKPTAANGIDTACLTFNAGVVPRIGPHRINVKLSRALATAGMTNLRFDLSGLGDSRSASGQHDFVQQAVADLRAAMDYLQQHHGFRKFVLVGNCSGAVHIYWTALADDRVTGVFMFDGYAYPTRWSRLIRHWKRFRSRTWRNAFSAIARRLLILPTVKRANSADTTSGSSAESSESPTRDEYSKGLQRLVGRGVSVIQVFSGSVIDYYSYARQFRDGFADQPFVEKVRCDFLPAIDHTLLALHVQKQFIEIVRDWALGVARSR